MTFADEDDRWIWGMFYYNPNDARLVVNARVGINSSFNMARRSAQVITGVGLVILLAFPLMGVWEIDMERTPVELEVTETELTGSFYGKSWSLELADIRSVELLEELPKMTRVNGTGMSNALTGTFRNAGLGKITCCVDPRSGPWLLVTQTDGRIYLLGSSTQGEVEEILSGLS